MLAAIMLVAAATLWVSGCAKKLVRESAPETSDTLSLTSYKLTLTSDTFTDERDAKRYKTVRMPDGKTWMAENLNYKTDSSWCCVGFGYDSTSGEYISKCDEFGRLYNWNAAAAACPAGWRLPSREDWDGLADALGGWEIAGKMLKSESGWNGYDEGENGNGTDDYGFSALPGGFRDLSGDFGNSGGYGNWWTAAEHGGDRAYIRFLYNETDKVYEDPFDKRYGFSVRCVRDGNTGKTAADGGKARKALSESTALDSGTFTDKRDGNTYKTTVIGGVRWMAENLKYRIGESRGTAWNPDYKTGESWCYGKSNSVYDCYDCRNSGNYWLYQEAWEQWDSWETPRAHCPNNYDNAFCEIHGRLYDWEAAKKACPPGWRLPSNQDWEDLVAAAGGKDAAGKPLKSKRGWRDFSRNNDKDTTDNENAARSWGGGYCQSGGGANEYGFSALPGGGYWSGYGFGNAGGVGYWWTATEYDKAKAYLRIMRYGNDAVEEVDDRKDVGFSVRCRQEGSAAEEERMEREQLRREKERQQQKAERDAEVKAKREKERNERIEKNTGHFTDTRDRRKYRKKEEEQRIEKLSAYFTDSRDGRSYRSVEIGGKRWMAENLNYKPDWKSNCYGKDYDDGGDDGISYCNKYGKLYDWSTAQTICPMGWRLPTREDWDSLARAAGGERRLLDNAWYGAGKTLKAGNGWNDYNGENGNGTDDYGFSALPGGSRFSLGEYFKGEGGHGVWWTASERGKSDAYYRDMYSRYDDEYEGFLNKKHGFSVRCVYKGIGAEEQKEIEEARIKKVEEQKRLEKLSTYFTDSRDGRKYRAVKIGGKRWMAENLSYQPKAGKSWCYDGDTLYCGKYGRLYDFQTAKTACPAGWRLPSRAEWDSLGRAVGGWSDGGSGWVSWFGAEKKLKARDGWGRNEYGGANYNGTDSFGFSALPGGSRYAYGFQDAGVSGRWWADTEHGDGKAYNRYIHSQSNSMQEYGYDIKGDGYSVRCVQGK